MSLLRVLLLCLFCAPVAIVATSHTVSPGDDWTDLLTGLQPGDSVVFNPQTPGTPYIYNFSHSNAWTLNGAANNPITIEGAVGESVTLNQLSDQYNCMDVVGSYFVIQNLALTSNIASVVGLSLKANVSNAVFDSLTVHDVLENAIKANTPGAVYDNVTFTNCEVYNTGHTGECFYLGCQPSGTPTDTIECVFKNGLIENNYCHDTCVSTDGCNGAGSDGSGFQLKGWGSYGNVLRRNVCKNVNSVCMLLYDDFDLGANIVEENWIYGSVIDAGIQVSAGAIIRNNIIYDNDVGIAVTSNSNNLEPTKLNRNIIIEGNTIIDNGSTGIDLPDAFSPTTGTRIQNNLVIQNSGNAFEGGDQSDILWLNNYFFGGSALAGVNSTGAIILGSASGVIVDAASFDFHPVSGSPVLAAGAALDPTDAAYDFDFNARSCSNPSVGAYESVGSGALSFGILPAPSGSESPCGAFGESACSACSVVETTTTGSTDSTTTGSTDTTTTGSTDTTTTGSTDTTTTGSTDTTTTGSTDTTTTGSTDTTTTGSTDTTTTGSTDTTTTGSTDSTTTGTTDSTTTGTTDSTTTGTTDSTTTGTTDSTTTGTTDSTTTGTTDSTTTGTTDSTTTGTTDSTTTGATTSSSTRAATTRTTTATTRTTTTISGTTTQEGTETSTLTTTTVGDDFTSGAKTARVCLALLVAFCLTLLF